MGLGEKFSRAIRPDAQAFDEIRITTVPRYKESEMSGDEWRISAKVEFFRKGVLRHTSGASNVNYAVQLLNAELIKQSEGGTGYYGGEENFCDQEGCAATATVTYQLKKQYCQAGHSSDSYSPMIRMFCDRHKTRGDCGLEDADSNYTQVER